MRTDANKKTSTQAYTAFGRFFCFEGWGRVRLRLIPVKNYLSGNAFHIF